MAITTGNLVGTWDMNHDGWHGTLAISPIDQRFRAVDGPCIYTSYHFDGTYTDSNGTNQPISGEFQGKDSHRRLGEPCPESDHRVAFTIQFAGQGQSFEGYLFTQDPTTMAGYTWWQGIPFAWYARKRG